jgi:hypothetical protein
MRTAIFTFAGTVEPGDLLMLSYRGSRGGRSTAKVFIADPPENGIQSARTEEAHRKDWATALTFDEMIAALAEAINNPSSEWSPGAGDFKATVKDNKILVMCSTLTDDVTFHFDGEGSGGITCGIDVLG